MKTTNNPIDSDENKENNSKLENTDPSAKVEDAYTPYFKEYKILIE
jgi:hypothetical protein